MLQLYFEGRWNIDEGLYRITGIRFSCFVLLKYGDAKERREVLQSIAFEEIHASDWRSGLAKFLVVTFADDKV